MGLFGKKNNCKFKDMCNIAGADGTCRFCATENYQDCDLYQDWSGGGINENNQCPHKDKCPCGEMTLRVVSITKTLSQQATTTHIRLAEAMMTTMILKRTCMNRHCSVKWKLTSL